MTCCAFTENKGIDLFLSASETPIRESNSYMSLRYYFVSSFLIHRVFRRPLAFVLNHLYRTTEALRDPDTTRPDRYFKELRPTNTEWRQKTLTISSLLIYNLRAKRVSTIRNRHSGMPTVISRTCQRSSRANYRQIREIARFASKPTGRMDWMRKLCNCHLVVISKCRVSQPPAGY